MSGKQAWRNWAIVFALLIVFAIATAVWSSIMPSFSLPGSGPEVPGAPPPEIEPIELDIPALPFALPLVGEGGETLELSPFIALGVLTAVVIGGILAVGVPLALIYVFLSRTATETVESESFRESQNRLEQKQKERLKEMREGRDTHGAPDHVMPRWSVISTSLIIIIFVAFFGMILSGTFFPEGEVMLFGSIVNPATIVVGILTFITVIVLAIRLRPQSILAEGDDQPIPWDSIAVLVSGLIIVGLTLGAMTYLLGLG